MIDLQRMVSDYGYWALFVGTFLEGETILVLGGLAAQQGLLELHWVMVSAFSGSLLGDQTAFFIGRRWGRRIICRFPGWEEKIEKIRQKMARYLDLWMLTFRFFWGLRNPTPFVLAMGNVSLARFATLNAIGALVWAVAGAGAGFLFGHAVERYLGDMHKYSLRLLAGVVGLWLLAMLVRYGFKRRRAAQGEARVETPAAEGAVAVVAHQAGAAPEEGRPGSDGGVG